MNIVTLLRPPGIVFSNGRASQCAKLFAQRDVGRVFLPAEWEKSAAVNEPAIVITLGLPIICTSVDHDTAFDLASKGVAGPQGPFAAIRVAVEMARGRKTAGAPT